MANFILHIGQSKTGTTAIQHFLSENRRILYNKGILYPDYFRKGMPLGVLNHNQIVWSLLGRKTPIGISYEKFFKYINQKLKKDDKLHTVILSAEAFLGEPHIWDCNSKVHWQKTRTEKMERLRSLLTDHEVKIIIYLRRQDFWVNSAYKHIIKIQGLIGRQLYTDINEFIEDMLPRLNYADEIRLWGKYFGQDSIIVRPYEKSQLIDGDVISDFLMISVGLENNVINFVHPSEIETKNEGYHRDILEVKKNLNVVSKSKSEERILIWALGKINHEYPPEYSEWDYLLTSFERMALIERFYNTNRWVAETYLDSVDGVLFRDPLPNNTNGVIDYPGLNMEKAFEIMIRVYRIMRTLEARCLYLRYYLGAFLRRNFMVAYVFLRPIYRVLVSKF